MLRSKRDGSILWNFFGYHNSSLFLSWLSKILLSVNWVSMSDPYHMCLAKQSRIIWPCAHPARARHNRRDNVYQDHINLYYQVSILYRQFFISSGPAFNTSNYADYMNLNRLLTCIVWYYTWLGVKFQNAWKSLKNAWNWIW
jgi:hypothetical protein